MDHVTKAAEIVAELLAVMSKNVGIYSGRDIRHEMAQQHCFDPIELFHIILPRFSFCAAEYFHKVYYSINPSAGQQIIGLKSLHICADKPVWAKCVRFFAGSCLVR